MSIGSQIEVLYNYESTTARGHSVVIQPGEKYFLVATSNDDWWYVTKEFEDEDGFYLPKSYVKTVEQPETLTTFRMVPTDHVNRISKIFSAEETVQPNSSIAERKGRLPRSESARSRVTKQSIPVDPHFMQSIPIEIDAHIPVTSTTAANGDAAAGNGMNHAKTHERNESNGSQNSSTTDDHIYANTSILNGLPSEQSTVAVSSKDNSSDDQPQYANLPMVPSAANGAYQMVPPVPDVIDQPIRALGSGWVEHADQYGRPYFFNAETGRSSWKPPRAKLGSISSSSGLKITTAVQTTLSSGDELDSSFSFDDPNRSADDLSPTLKEQPLDLATEIRPLSPSPADSTFSSIPPPPMMESQSVTRSRAPPQLPVKNKPGNDDKGGINDSRHGSLNQARGLFFQNPAFGLMSRSGDDADSLQMLSDTDIPVKEGGTLKKSSTLPFKRNYMETEKFVKAGPVIKCKVIESGQRLPKKHWEPCFIYLTSCHLLFYKDQKAAEKKGVTYEPPQGICDLRGAATAMADEEYTRKKYTFQIDLVDHTVYLFNCRCKDEFEQWLQTLQMTLSKLPKVSLPGSPLLDSIGRNEHEMQSSSYGLPSQPIRIDGVIQSQVQVSRGKTEKRPKPVGFTRQSDVQNSFRSGISEVDCFAHSEFIENRDNILEKLRRFFRQRPSVDQLKARGIYKPEPVFGSSLIEICKKEQRRVPLFVDLCTQLIEERGVDADGIYRISGNLSSMQKIRCQADHYNFSLLQSETDIHVLTGTLKLFFRELQEPVFPLSTTKDFLNAIRVQNAKQRLKTFRELLSKMPTSHHDTLDHLLRHLLKVAAHSSKNRMQQHNLAIVFGPTLFSTNQNNNPSSGKKKRNSAGGINDVKQKRKSSGGSSSSPAKPSELTGGQSNSHMAFNMIMQGQIVEFMLNSHPSLFDVEN